MAILVQLGKRVVGVVVGDVVVVDVAVAAAVGEVADNCIGVISMTATTQLFDNTI